jgi:hypothetical protein
MRLSSRILRPLLPSEHDMQVSVFDWAMVACRTYPDLVWLYAIPNAGKRSPQAARWMIAEGLRKGVPDVCLPAAHGGFTHLYIEHKRGNEKPLEHQLGWHKAMRARGALVCISRSFEQSRRILVWYCELAVSTSLQPAALPSFASAP